MLAWGPTKKPKIDRGLKVRFVGGSTLQGRKPFQKPKREEIQDRVEQDGDALCPKGGEVLTGKLSKIRPQRSHADSRAIQRSHASGNPLTPEKFPPRSFEFVK